MRFVVFGAGAIGCLVGANLARGAQDVVMVARGANARAIREAGLTLVSPTGRSQHAVAVSEAPESIKFDPTDLVLLCVKSQDTIDVLRGLSLVAADAVPVLCVQNGVENERSALRWFRNVYSANVRCPATHPAPATVYSYHSPGPGRLDVGPYQVEHADLSASLCAVFRQCGFESEERGDIRRWKYRKLLINLPNAIDALCGRDARESQLAYDVRAEGEACLRAAGIEFMSPDPAEERLVAQDLAEIDGSPFPGGSSWQSFDRSLGSVETDYLNGEIVLLGRLSGFPTPLNAALQRLTTRRAALGGVRSSMSVAELTQKILVEV